MGKSITLNNLFCQNCKRNRCICDADARLQQIHNDIKDSPAKVIIGDALELIGDLKKIAQKHGYYKEKKELVS